MKFRKLFAPFVITQCFAFALLFHTLAESAEFKDVYGMSEGKRYLALKVPLKNGVPNGKVTSYASNGKVLWEQNYIDGLMDGEGEIQTYREGNVKVSYRKGRLHGQVTHDGKVLHEFEDGFPKGWDSIYQNPFSKLSNGQEIVTKIVKLNCGDEQYFEEEGDLIADTVKLSQADNQLVATRCLSQGAGCGDGQRFVAKIADHSDSNGFKTYKSDTEGGTGELKVRVFKAKNKISLQAYGFLQFKPHQITATEMKQEDTALQYLFIPQYENNLDPRDSVGLKKIELNCK